MTKYINLTEEQLVLVGADGERITLPPSGQILDISFATQTSVVNGILYTEKRPVSTKEGKEMIRQLREKAPDAILIGTSLAAEAYRGDVVCPVPAGGRRNDGNKFYRSGEFRIYR